MGIGERADAEGMITPHRLLRCALALVLIVPAVGVLATPPARAATITVTTVDDVVDPSDGVISLREAIDAANSSPGDDEIVLGTGTYVVDLGAPGDNANVRGDLDHTDTGALTITGAGRDDTVISTTLASRVLHMRRGNLILSGLTIADGSVDSGAGVYVQNGSLSATDVAFRDNRTTGNRIGGGARVRNDVALDRVVFDGNESRRGGGIVKTNGGTVVITDSSFTSNHARQDGGAVHVNSNAATTAVSGSTFAANTAGRHGGAVFVRGSSFTHTTVSGNSAANRAGGIYVPGQTISLAHVTLVDNDAPNQASNLRAANATISHSIVAGGGTAPSCWRSATTGGGNFLGDTSCGGGASDIVDGGDPGLAPLADAGGGTATRVPEAGSPVIDLAVASPFGVDQRGVARPSGPAADAGAVEVRQPVPVDDDVTIDEDTPVRIDVAGNDPDPDALLDPSVVATVTPPTAGVTTDNGDGTISYTPNADAHGVDTFSYTNGFGTATVTVRVTPVNDAPVASPDTGAGEEDVPVTVDVLDNDTDVDGDILTVSGITSQPANGVAIDNGDGTITFTPEPDWNGADSYTYELSDGNGGTASATVSVTITPVNDAPRLLDGQPATLILAEDSSSTTETDAWFLDPEGDPLTIVSVGPAAHGATEVGSVVYTPNRNYHGPDAFDVIVRDTAGATFTTTVAVTVTPVDDAPVVWNESIVVLSGETITIDVLANDVDPDGDPMSLAILSVTDGTARVVGGEVEYTSAETFEGTATVVYAVTAAGVTVEGTLTLAVEQGLPATGITTDGVAIVAAVLLTVGSALLGVSRRFELG